MSRLAWTAYDVLGVRADSTPEEIKAAWKSKAKELHPDVGGDPALFDKVCRAYEELSKRPESGDTQEKVAREESDYVTGYEGLNIDFTDEIFTPCDGGIKQVWVDTMLTPPFGYRGTREQWISATIKSRKKMYQRWDTNRPSGSASSFFHKPEWSMRKSTRSRTPIPAKLKARYYLLGSAVGLLAVFSRISGVTYNLLSPHYGQPIFLSQWSGRPGANQIPLHTTGAVIGGLLLGLLIGGIWIKRSLRGRFHLPEKIALALIIVTLAFAGEFVVVGSATLPVLAFLTLYALTAGRIHMRLPKVSKRSKSLQTTG